MVFAYVIITVIVLVNLLIAMMGSSFAQVQGSAESVFRSAQVKLVLDYCSGNRVSIPPLNLVTTPIIFIGFAGLQILNWGQKDPTRYCRHCLREFGAWPAKHDRWPAA